jgi:hypothetical protein
MHLQRTLDELQTLLTDRRDLLNSEVSLLLRALAKLIAFVAQHPDPHIRRQRLHDLHQVLRSTATIIRLAAKNPIADRLRTIPAAKGRSALTPKIDEIIAAEASGVQQRHPKWSDTEVARHIKDRVNKQIATAAAKAGVNKGTLDLRAIAVRLKRIRASIF